MKGEKQLSLILIILAVLKISDQSLERVGGKVSKIKMKHPANRLKIRSLDSKDILNKYLKT